ncbi:putative membrane-bound dehydrogenase domain-containing protein [Pricia antarctica]|uniref:Putative membrane-bound dehydrogenase domain-containing protein n=1 Tax=Pricia antarctica TaxID=641691 RepID=A0A1G6YN71_9FLAO|nr:PVC-type heme-binding CxxCH protein [Pricia antarctica]SDD91849.1 putative membrane-bound dehydrogenase domain-containing protein [Pricia antarctica]
MGIFKTSALGRIFPLLFLVLVNYSCDKQEDNTLTVEKGSHIVLVGNNLGSRMMNFGQFETEMQLRYPNDSLYIRNMCDGGNTPGFRPHAARKSPWAFPGAEKYEHESGEAIHFVEDDGNHQSGPVGHFPSPDEWITSLKADIIIAFFGYSESFEGPDGLDNYKEELRGFIKHTLSQKYNGSTVPQLALVSPIAFEDLSEKMDLPDGKKENENLALYTEAMKEVAEEEGVLIVDAFEPTQEWFKTESTDLTQDGFQLTDQGYQKFAKLLADRIFGEKDSEAEENRQLVHKAVNEKNWFWHNDFKIPNGVHAYGRRYDPFGPDNYPYEIEKIRQMTAIRDTAIWEALQGKKMDLAKSDARTKKLPAVETNYKPSEKNGTPEYLYGQDALNQIKAAPGYKVELFASEEEFPDLANPVQVSFDNKGRLWVAVMPSYPHYRPGDSKPNDKLLILEDTNGDNKADKQTIFADSLHLTIGFEFAPEGVFLSQGTNLVLLKDTDGDDKADVKEIVLSGFDDHDTHHAISAFTADPSGAIYMGEGTFLHTNVETAYGPVRGTNGGFYRYSPQRHYLERTAQLAIPNPWGIAFDTWGQPFFEHTSGPSATWMMPGTILPRYGVSSPIPENLIEKKHLVRPTSGLEFVSSRHFPDKAQGNMLIANTIGFLGIKEHSMVDDPKSAGYLSKHQEDLITSSDKNFRPVDMEFAPDGSLYFIDWSNVLIGHMQHNARDPLRDHVHGRVYRITYPSRPLVEPAKIVDASIEELLDNLKLPEYRTRYRTKRELRARDASEVLSKLKTWVADLDTNDTKYEHNLLEALWVTWGLDKVDEGLLKQVLGAKDFRARAAAVGVLRYAGHQIPDQADLLMQAAKDDNPRVRLEALVSASWLGKYVGIPIITEAGKKGLDEWMKKPYESAIAHLNGHRAGEAPKEIIDTDLKGRDLELLLAGEEVYDRDGYCATCHQPDGQGLEASGFPPLAGSKWVTGSEDRLIKLVTNGVMGPIEVNGKTYPGQVPMTPFGKLLNDEETAAVLTYVRNSFGNKASAISTEKVKQVQDQIKDKTGFYSPEELLKEHPLE